MTSVDGARAAGRRWSAIALLALLATLTAAGPAGAHASLQTTSPPAGTVAVAAPAALTLTFTEEVSVVSSGVKVIDPSGHALTTQAVSDPASASTVTVRLPQRLLEGTYTVNWNVLSIDGHPLSGGAYRFAVGRVTLPLTVPDGGDPPLGPSRLGATGRVLAAGGALALAGLVAFPLLAVRPVRRRLMRATDPELADAMVARVEGRLPRWAALFAVVAVAGTLMVLLDNVSRTTGLSVPAVLGDPLGLIAALFNRTGGLLVARLLLLGAAGAVVLLPTTPSRPARVEDGPELPPLLPSGAKLLLTLALALAGLLTFSLSSHAAAARTDRWVRIGSDAVHLLASALWIGGLLGLALIALPAARDLGGQDRTRVAEIAGTVSTAFSVMAQLAMVAVLATGSYAALEQVTGLSDLSGTAWGVELTAKLALWVVVLLVAGINAVLLVPRLADRSAAGTRRLATAGDLRSAIRLELALAAGLVVTASLMSATAQPSDLPGRLVPTTTRVTAGT